MFDFDSLREIASTVSKNKMRTFLTGVAVAWGIFMLIILLAAGNGLKNGVTSNFAARAVNSVRMWPGWTSMPYKGLPMNRNIKFDEKVYDIIATQMPEIEYISPHSSRTAIFSHNKEYGSWGLSGVSPDAPYIHKLYIRNQNGRFINQLDIEQKRKVMVINSDIQKVLFKDESPLGKYVEVENIVFQIIGIYEDKEGMMMGSPPAYIPFSTAQALYSGGYGFDRIDFTVVGLDTEAKNDEFTDRLRAKVGVVKGFDPTDRSAIYIRNSAKDSLEAEAIFGKINFFVLIIGVASLMAGIVGVGNIMLITVKERTREIGIRKAIGARPISILKLIILESIIITTTAGYLGIVLGVGLTELISGMLGGGDKDTPAIFKDPTVDLSTIVYATLFLIVCGVIAGFIPALKATKVSPIEAMRSE